MPLPFQVRNHHGAMEQPRLPLARVSRFRRVLVRVSAAGRLAGDGKEKDRDERPPSGEAEEVSAGVDRMVLSFMEDAAAATYSMGAEQNLLADASRIAERCHKGGRKKTDVRRAVADGLRALGYDAAVCKSRWEKTTSYPAGEHEYIDAVVEAGSTRLIVEVDFQSEFELARSTKAYRAALQALPPLFVGTPDRLGQIVAVVAEAARQSLKKKGLHFPPWRKPEYMRAKWLSPHVRCSDKQEPPPPPPTPVSAASFTGEFELLFDGKTKVQDAAAASIGEEKITVLVSPSPWQTVEPEASKKRPEGKVVTGLASVL